MVRIVRKGQGTWKAVETPTPVIPEPQPIIPKPIRPVIPRKRRIGILPITPKPIRPIKYKLISRKQRRPL